MNIPLLMFFKLKSRGHDTSRHVLTCFGGAGGQHACTIARILGMKTVFIHRYVPIGLTMYKYFFHLLLFDLMEFRYAGILSAFGMALANVVHETQEPCAKIYGQGNIISGTRAIN